MNLDNALIELKKYYGYDSFRNGQDRIVDSILSMHDTVGIMPTGAGKSLCFQLPAIMLEGITIVISPLISLMKDQVNSLTQLGIKAAYLNSSLTVSQYNTVLTNIKSYKYKIIYVAPERLMVNEFIDIIASMNVAMLTVDEAHCVSQWGQDFRPSYMHIVSFIKRLPARPIISAFTATATEKVKEDIISILELNNPYVVTTGFDRKNLYFEVQHPKDKREALKNFLKDKADESGIVYCSTRDTVEEICDFLCDLGYSATRYHAGLSDNERKENQEQFIFDDKKIIVATNAFGMGIDKSNVSFVVHFNMPKDIESYYQEAGRAGRDGNDAQCLLLYNGQDIRTNLYMIENSNDREYENAASEKILKARDRERLKVMNLYCHTTECLRKYILEYFGETASDSCDNCSNCQTEYETADITIPAQKIISCIIRVRENYGSKMIIDILRGSKNKRIMELGLNRLSTYNIMTESDTYIKQIINFLILNNYLYATNDEYPVLKLNKKAQELLTGKESLSMKQAKHIPSSKGSLISSSKRTMSAASNSSHDVNHDILTELKALRLEIAKEQKVPAFMIFSDSTLIDMCIKLPKTDEEFLDVSGVGQVKLKRFGDRFISIINSFNNDTIIDKNTASKDKSDESNENEIAFANNETNTANTVPDSVQITEDPVAISVIADNINCVLMQHGQKISAQKITGWLVANEYLEIIEENNKKNRIPTAKGEALGINKELKKKHSGESYYMNFYSRDAQQFIISNIDNILN